MRSGRRIAFDVGKARIGVAMSDFHAILATPAEHIVRTSDLLDSVNLAIALITKNDCIEAYVGLPVNLQNKATESTSDAIDFARVLADLSSIDVRLIDERFTTTSAANSLRAAGHTAKDQKSIIDSAAAAIILEQALALEKTLDAAPGQRIQEHADEE